MIALFYLSKLMSPPPPVPTIFLRVPNVILRRCFRHPRTSQKVAKAYGVFMDEELNKKYHFFLDHPVSAWWSERRSM